MTLLELIQVTADFFKKKGIPSPRFDAERIIAASLGLKRIELYLQLVRPILGAVLDKLRPLVKRRGERVPLQHILQTADFWGLSFRSDSRALVPRPETEILLETALAKTQPESGTLWDVGTGSGIIPISFLREKKGWRATGLDFSPDALALARENAEKLSVSDRADWLLSDLLDNAPDGCCNLMAANLPYIPSGILESLPPEVRHDPASALDGGSDGLALIARLIESAPPKMAPGSFLILEIGEEQTTPVCAMLEKAGFISAETIKDLNGKPRIVSAQKNF